MPVAVAFRVLFLFLVALLPMPCFWQDWGVLPPLRFLYLVYTELVSSGLTEVSLLALVLMLIHVLAAGLIAHAYSTFSRQWPSRIRGSVLGISVLSLLIVFSSMAIYRLPLDAAPNMTFLQLY